MYYVINYDLKDEKTEAFRDLINSARGKRIIRHIEKDTGARFSGMYFPVMGFGMRTGEEWWELPNIGALDKFRESKGWQEAIAAIYEMLDLTKAMEARILRSITDVKSVSTVQKKKVK